MSRKNYFVCSSCGFKTTSMEKLNEHNLRHKNYRCPYCGVSMLIGDVNIEVQGTDSKEVTDTAVKLYATIKENGLGGTEIITILEDIKESLRNIKSTSGDISALVSSVNSIEQEMKKQNPDKTILKSAIQKLDMLKNTAEFGAAIGTLYQILAPFLGI